jgi:hypothetical protein
MLMTPWLAAGVGVVLAAALALHGPHAELTYTPANPSGPCAPGGCGATEPGQGSGGTAMSGPGSSEASPGTRLKHGQKAVPTASPAPHRSGPAPVQRPLVIRYRTVRSRLGGFTGLITMTGQAVRSGWHLTFRYPGARVESVAGLPWTVDGAAVTVAGPPTSPGHGAARVRIRFRASGTPSRPTGCTINGTACSIH